MMMPKLLARDTRKNEVLRARASGHDEWQGVEHGLEGVTKGIRGSWVIFMGVSKSLVSDCIARVHEYNFSHRRSLHFFSCFY